MTVKVIAYKVKSDSKIYTPEEGNNIIEGLSEKEETRLIKDGFCEAVEIVEETQGVEDTEKYEIVAKALDDKYNRDPLAVAAKKAGVEFKDTAKKGEIIDAIIKQGKAEILLENDGE